MLQLHFKRLAEVRPYLGVHLDVVHKQVLLHLEGVVVDHKGFGAGVFHDSVIAQGCEGLLRIVCAEPVNGTHVPVLLVLAEIVVPAFVVAAVLDIVCKLDVWKQVFLCDTKVVHIRPDTDTLLVSDCTSADCRGTGGFESADVLDYALALQLLHSRDAEAHPGFRRVAFDRIPAAGNGACQDCKQNDGQNIFAHNNSLFKSLSRHCPD